MGTQDCRSLGSKSLDDRNAICKFRASGPNWVNDATRTRRWPRQLIRRISSEILRHKLIISVSGDTTRSSHSHSSGYGCSQNIGIRKCLVKDAWHHCIKVHLRSSESHGLRTSIGRPIPDTNLIRISATSLS